MKQEKQPSAGDERPVSSVLNAEPASQPAKRMNYTETLRALTGMMTISGFEERAADKIRELFGPDFNEIAADRAGNLLLTKKCGRPNAKKIMLDAHLDEVGMIVDGIYEGGFLSVSPVGGIDLQLLPASEVLIYGKKTLYGVFTATSPQLAGSGGGKNALDWDELRIDTGYSREELEELVEIGTPVGYGYSGEELPNGRITGRGFDDKACAAGLIQAVLSLSPEEMAGDVTITLSAREEVGGHGAGCAAFALHPDFAIITDVNFARTPGVPSEESGRLGEGAMVSLSAVTDRRLTARVLSLAEKAEIPVTTVVEATSTGTNASCVVLVNEGIPAAVVSIPLAGMHSYTELLDVRDAEAFVDLIREIVRQGDSDQDRRTAFPAPAYLQPQG